MTSGSGPSLGKPNMSLSHSTVTLPCRVLRPGRHLEEQAGLSTPRSGQVSPLLNCVPLDKQLDLPVHVAPTLVSFLGGEDQIK